MSTQVFEGELSGVRWEEGDPDEVARDLLKVSHYLDDTSLPLLAARRIAIQDTRDHFDQERDPDGQDWVPLSDAYLASKLAQGYPEDILHREGHLEDAATSEQAWLITENSLVFNSAVLPSYGLIHQDGSDAGGFGGRFDAASGGFMHATSHFNAGKRSQEIGRGGALPQRRFIGLSEEALGEIAFVFDLWADEAVNIMIQPETALFPGLVMTRGAGGRFTGVL